MLTFVINACYQDGEVREPAEWWSNVIVGRRECAVDKLQAACIGWLEDRQSLHPGPSLRQTARRQVDDDDDDEGRINFSVALSPKTTRTRNNKPKQWSHVIVVSAMRRC